jgi:hypothetical protein
MPTAVPKPPPAGDAAGAGGIGNGEGGKLPSGSSRTGRGPYKDNGSTYASPRRNPRCRQAAGRQCDPVTSSDPIGSPASTRAPTRTWGTTGW